MPGVWVAKIGKTRRLGPDFVPCSCPKSFRGTSVPTSAKRDTFIKSKRNPVVFNSKGKNGVFIPFSGGPSDPGRRRTRKNSEKMG